MQIWGIGVLLPRLDRSEWPWLGIFGYEKDISGELAKKQYAIHQSYNKSQT